MLGPERGTSGRSLATEKRGIGCEDRGNDRLPRVDPAVERDDLIRHVRVSQHGQGQIGHLVGLAEPPHRDAGAQLVGPCL